LHAKFGIVASANIVQECALHAAKGISFIKTVQWYKMARSPRPNPEYSRDGTRVDKTFVPEKYFC
jgi:hypothetical protein